MLELNSVVRSRTPWARSLACPGCGAPLTVRVPGHSSAVNCDSCGRLIDTAHPELAVLQQAQQKLAKINPEIELGSRGTLRGTDWQMVGVIERSDKSGRWRWREFLLFNPYQGYRWLVLNQGHWSLVTPIYGAIPADVQQADTVRYRGDTYKVFAREPAVVRQVLGEVYWRVKRGDQVFAADFVAPPRMLSAELDGTEVNWSWGEYLPPEEVKAAFPQARLPKPQGVAPHQPNPVGKLGGWLVALAVLVFLVTQFVACGTKREAEVLRRTVAFEGKLPVDTLQAQLRMQVEAQEATVTKLFRRGFTLYERTAMARHRAALRAEQQKLDSLRNALRDRTTALRANPTTYPSMTVVLDSFRIEGSRAANLEMHFESVDRQQFNNTWVEFEADLTNEETGANLQFFDSFEYYSGRDSDGPWSEGSEETSSTLRDIPPGTYSLVLTLTAPKELAGHPFQVRAVYDTPVFLPFFMGLLLLLLPAMWIGARRHNFEVQRWSNSDFTPYTGSDDSSDDD